MLSSYSFAITVLNVCMCMSCHAEVLNECNVYAFSCHGATNQQGRHLVSSFTVEVIVKTTHNHVKGDEMPHIQGPVT